MPRHTSPIYATLILVTLIMAASLFFILSTLRQEQAVQSQEFRDSIIWITTQIEREARIFHDRTDRFSHRDPSFSHEDLVTSFDILWSRIDSTDQGALGRLFMALDGAPEVRRRAQAILRQLEPVVSGLQPGDAAAAETIHRQLDLLLGDLHQVALSATRYDQIQREARRSRFMGLYRNALLILGGSLCSGSLLAVLLFHRQRSLDWLRQNLEQRVEQRTAELAESNRNLAQEIVEHLQTAASLRRFRFALDNSGDAIFIIDRQQMRFVDINQTACDSVGYDRDELLTMGPQDIDPRYDRERLAREFDQAIASGRPNVIETGHRRKDGSEFPVEIPLRAWQTDGRQLIVASVRDISERKQVEAEMLRLRQLLQNIFDSMPSLLIGVDADGRVNQWNREAELRTGLSRQQVLGKPLAEALPSPAIDSRELSQAIERRQVITEARLPFECQEQSRFADLTIYPLATDQEGGAVIRIDDMTERIRIDELMIQTEKMMSVGGLAAGMAHEINNPLAGILQNAQVIRNRLLSDLPKNRQTAEACGTSLETVQAYLKQRSILDMLDAITAAGERAARIVDNMLSFSRKTDSRFSLQHLDRLLDATLELAAGDYDLKSEYDFRRIEIVRDYDAELPAVPCEATQIQQVLLNLLKNGAQAMTDWCFTGDVPRFTLRLKREQTMARIEVEDNGPGMEEATCKRIFEPFYTTKQVGVGTGLGLSVSYFIITENHGGTMAVESQPDRGSRFIIRLPLAGLEPEQPHAVDQ